MHRMTSSPTQDCCRRTPFASTSPGQGRQTGKIDTPCLGSAEIAFIETFLVQGTYWDRWQPDTHHAGAGTGVNWTETTPLARAPHGGHQLLLGSTC